MQLILDKRSKKMKALFLILILSYLALCVSMTLEFDNGLDAQYDNGSVETIIRSDSNINKKRKPVDTLVRKAAKIGDLNTLELLVKWGVEINITLNGRTPLHVAAKNGKVNVLKFLSKYIDIDARDPRNITALFLAAKRRHWGCAKTLIELGANFKLTGTKNETILHAASNNCSDGMMKFLLQLPIDVNAQDNDGRTALFITASEGHLKCLELLVGNGADPNLRDNIRRTAIHVATENGRADVLRFLVVQDIDINARDRYNNTAIELAVKGGDLECLKVLIYAEADPCEKDFTGSTLMHEAARRGFVSIIRELRQCSDSINARDENQATPLLNAILLYRKEAAQELIDMGAQIGSEVMWAAYNNEDIDMLHYLIQNGGDVNALDDVADETLLMNAVASNNTEMVTFLLKEGADVEATDSAGWTALHVAATFWNGQSLVKLLLDKGANINAKDASGLTPLDLAEPENRPFLMLYGAESGTKM